MDLSTFPVVVHRNYHLQPLLNWVYKAGLTLKVGETLASFCITTTLRTKIKIQTQPLFIMDSKRFLNTLCSKAHLETCQPCTRDSYHMKFFQNCIPLHFGQYAENGCQAPSKFSEIIWQYFGTLRKFLRPARQRAWVCRYRKASNTPYKSGWYTDQQNYLSRRLAPGQGTSPVGCFVKLSACRPPRWWAPRWTLL